MATCRSRGNLSALRSNPGTISLSRKTISGPCTIDHGRGPYRQTAGPANLPNNQPNRQPVGPVDPTGHPSALSSNPATRRPTGPPTRRPCNQNRQPVGPVGATRRIIIVLHPTTPTIRRVGLTFSPETFRKTIHRRDPSPPPRSSRKAFVPTPSKTRLSQSLAHSRVNKRNSM